MKFALPSALSVVLALAGQLAHAGPIILNGSFELGPTPGIHTTLYPGSTAIDGWTVSILGGSVDYIGSEWVASDGSRSLDLDGYYQVGGVTTTFATTPGQEYLLTFDLAGNPGGGPTVKQLLVSVGEVANHLFTFDITGHSYTSMGWTTQNLFFTATGDATSLTFLSGDEPGNAYGPALDNVQVKDCSEFPGGGATEGCFPGPGPFPVPEPASTLVLLSMGLAGLGAVRRRMRK